MLKNPQLQIHVGKDDVRISTGHPLIDDIAAQLEKSRKFTSVRSVSSLFIALLASALFLHPYVCSDVKKGRGSKLNDGRRCKAHPASDERH